MRYTVLAPFPDNHMLLVRPQGKGENLIVVQHLITYIGFFSMAFGK